MAQPKKMCGRCWDPTPATQTRKFSIDESHFLVDVCENHAERFDNDLWQWSRYGYDDESYAPPQRVHTRDEIERQKAAAELRSKQAPQPVLRVVEPTPTLPIHVEHAAQTAWSMTSHARERMAERGYSEVEVLQAALNPELVLESDKVKYGPESRVHRKGDVMIVVVIDRKLVITCLPRGGYIPRPDYVSPRVATR